MEDDQFDVLTSQILSYAGKCVRTYIVMVKDASFSYSIENKDFLHINGWILYRIDCSTI